jgi:hypothetical protein
MIRTTVFLQRKEEYLKDKTHSDFVRERRQMKVKFLALADILCFCHTYSLQHQDSVCAH